MSKVDKKKSDKTNENVDNLNNEVITSESVDPTNNQSSEPNSKNNAQATAVDEVSALNEKLLRSFAEFDNFKKRTAREKLELAEYTKVNCFKEILGVVDNFERALECESNDANFKKGMEMILVQLKDSLKAQGLVEIEALSKEFDPTYHNAINQIADENLPSNTVCNVLQKGYTIGEKVVRHAMVVVVQ